jgi:hypothetical protein
MRRSVLSAARSCNALGWRERAPDLDRMSSATTGTATDDPKSEQSRRDARTETIHASTCDLLRARPTAPGVPPSSAWLVRRIGCGPVQRGRGTGACAGVDGHRMAGVCRTSREVVNHQGGRRVDWRGWPATALRLDCEAQAPPARGRKVRRRPTSGVTANTMPSGRHFEDRATAPPTPAVASAMLKPSSHRRTVQRPALGPSRRFPRPGVRRPRRQRFCAASVRSRVGGGRSFRSRRPL